MHIGGEGGRDRRLSLGRQGPDRQNRGEPEVLIVTAASAEFYRCLCQLLLSVRRHHAPARCCVYDLGLKPTQATDLRIRFPDIAVRRFEFDNYPGHVRVDAETYAWKPLVIARELASCGGPLLWLDAATIIQSRLDAIEAKIREEGQYVPISGNHQATVERWTHPATLARLGIPAGPVRTMRQRAGGVCGFDGRNPVVSALVRRWKDLALQEDVIAPPGSNRGNHRQDQALLTLLLVEAEQSGRIRLTPDEIDVGSSCPIPWLSARNRVSNSVPLFLDSLVRLFYVVHRWQRTQAQRGRQRGLPSRSG
jgi:hypothetical protein